MPKKEQNLDQLNALANFSAIHFFWLALISRQLEMSVLTAVPGYVWLKANAKSKEKMGGGDCMVVID